MNFDGLLHRANELRARDGVRGRYAPSPTGPLHLGNVRTALVAWLQARLAGGAFVMRNEDLDQPRVVEGSAEQIYDDLRWLGLDWDEGPDVGGPLGPYDQSERSGIYREALELLRAKGLAFRCYCSRRDVREAASAPHGPYGVIYPGTCRNLTPAEEDAVQAEKPDRLPAWRFKGSTIDQRVELVDRVAGRYSQHLADEIGDFVIRRADDLFAYQLAVVVDDGLMGITDVVRGEDLLSSTPRQIALFEALDLPVPEFWHVPLMVDASGERLSKRDGSDSLRMLRDQGATPEGVVGQLAHSLGLIDRAEPISAAELLAETSLGALTDAVASRSDPPE